MANNKKTTPKTQIEVLENHLAQSRKETLDLLIENEALKQRLALLKP